MKKLILTVLCAAMLMTMFAGCGESGKRIVEGELKDILQKVYDGLDESFHVPPVAMAFTLSEDMGIDPPGYKIEYYIGAKNIPFTEAIASEPMIGGAYSVVLLRMEKNANIKGAMDDIKGKVDTTKWICYITDVLIVDNIGDLVIMIMTNDQTAPGLGKAIHDSFKALK